MKKTILYLLICLLPYYTNAQLHLLNDEFDNSASLSNWQNINDVEGWNAEHLEVFDVDITQTGKLTMMPHTSSWYREYRGTILFKEVTGDFIITTEVTATDRAGTGVPSSDYSLAGVMIRSPRNFSNGAAGWTPNGENYVFLACGQGNDSYSNPSSPGPHFEVKTTINSNSNLAVNPIPTASNVQIRIARIGAYVICLYRLPDGNWTVHRRFNRSDFPATMQIGFVTYTDWGKVSTYDPLFQNSNVITADLNPDPSDNPSRVFNPDLIGGFEFARFDSVYLPVPLVGVNLVNGGISDNDLLSFLGYESVPYAAPSLALAAKLFLEGPFNIATELMADNLRQAALLPMEQPFSNAPWNYGGEETIGAGVLAVDTHDAIVDWVLVELRDGNDPSVVLAQKAALVQRDGDVVAAEDGASPLLFDNLPDGQYYIAVAHRNHLACMTLNPLSLDATTTNVDFTTLPTYGSYSQAQVGPSQALWAGDMDNSGIIDASDRSAAWNDRNQGGYLGVDANMDGNCDAGDRSIGWNNRNRGAAIP